MSPRKNATPVPPEDLADLEAFRAHDSTDNPAPKPAGKNGQARKRWLNHRRLSDLTPQEVELLWNGRLVVGKVNNLQGAGGLGKTFIALDIAARWTTGAPFPGETATREPGTVYYLSAEDGVEDTLLPRLEAAGADTSRCYVANGAEEPDGEGGTRPAPLSLQYVSDIRHALEETGATLLIVDPVTSFLGAGVDMNKAAEVRPILEGLNRTADELGVTIVFVMHVGKSQGGPSSAAYRALGSVDFVNVARSILVVAEKDGQRFLAHAKQNLSARAQTLSYGLGPSGYRLGAREIPRTVWHGVTHLTAEDLYAQDTKQRGPAPSVSDDQAADLLLEVLTDGPMGGNDLGAYLKDEHDVSERIYKRVRGELKERGHIEDRRDGFMGRVLWHLVNSSEGAES